MRRHFSLLGNFQGVVGLDSGVPDHAHGKDDFVFVGTEEFTTRKPSSFWNTANERHVGSTPKRTSDGVPPRVLVLGERDGTWTSQRDHLLLRLLHNRGARVSEIIGVTLSDVVLDGTACVLLHGKGRRQHTVPLWLWPSTARHVRAWLGATRGCSRNRRCCPTAMARP